VPPIYIYKTGDEPRKQDTQANKGSTLLSEEVPYQITLIGLSQGNLDRTQSREFGIWIGGGGRKSSRRCSRSMTATRLRTWKVRADLRKVVMDELAQDVSWEREGGTKILLFATIYVTLK